MPADRLYDHREQAHDAPHRVTAQEAGDSQTASQVSLSEGKNRAASSEPDQPAVTERNVVVVVADDHGQDAGAYGNEAIHTPNMDALAADGTLFTHAFATTASCSASRSVILSGLHNHANGQFGHEHNYSDFESHDHVRSLPVMMAEGGYRTAQIGKYHVAPRSVYRFDEFLEGPTRNPVQMAENVKSFVNRDSHAPFFLYYATSDPHRGGGVAEELPHAPDRFGNRPEGEARRGIQPVRYDPADVEVPPFLPDNEVTRAELAQYYQSVSRVDQGLGRLIDVLKEAGVYDETLIIYMSDHGMAFPGAKTTTYEPGLRSPLIVRNPYEEQRGVVSEAMVSWVDLMPTILDFAGIAPPVYEQPFSVPGPEGFPDEHGLHGKSFLSLLDGRSPGDDWNKVHASHTFHEIQMYYPMRVVRGRDYKLIWNVAHQLPYPFASDLWAAPTWQNVYDEGMDASFGVRTIEEYIHRPEFELYNMREDPYESNNLASDPAYNEVLRDYMRELEAFQRESSDPWYLKWSYE